MDLYQTLGLTPAATAEEIREAYRRLRSTAHPDKQGDASMFIQIQKAYDVLSDPERRTDYDSTGSTEYKADSIVQVAIIETVMSMISQIDPASQNPLKLARQQVEQSIQQGHAQIHALQNEIAKSEKVCKRLTRKNGKTNFIEISIKYGIEQTRKRIAELQQKMVTAGEILQVLDEFEYETDPQQHVVFYRVGPASLQTI